MALPVTAANGDALAALFAGARDARSTVSIPMIIPAAMLGRLMAKVGMVAKYMGLSARRRAHSTQMTIMPRMILEGIA